MSASATVRSSLDPRIFGQYPTQRWVAEALVQRYFPDLCDADLVIEPSCHVGSFLQAIPAGVPAIGVEIDPALAAEAQRRTGRRVLVGDFCDVEIPDVPTAIIGNPPFKLDLIDRFLDRSHDLLPNSGRLGFLLPAYAFQTASRVSRYARRWSLRQEMIPRNIYPGLNLPLVFAVFTKDGAGEMYGFALYREVADVQQMDKPYRDALANARGSIWEAVAVIACERLGGECTLQALYSEIEANRPTQTRFWREQIRKVLQTSARFVRIVPGRYALVGGDEQVAA